VADGGARPRALTHATADDGQDLRELALSDDGALLAYARGGDNGRPGESPNPTSDPRGARREVWVVSVAGGDPWRVAEGATPAFSPSGKQLAFVAGGQLHLASGDRFKDDLKLQLRGTVDDPRWSPDGALLAFAVNRGHHAFIAVYDLARRSVTWLAPGFDSDLAPAWSPDGTQVAFIRHEGAKFPGDERRPLWKRNRRFAIWTADARSGRGQPVWSSQIPDGGYAEWTMSPPLFWAADGRLIFYAESDGWMRAYSVSTSGGPAQPLSPTGCEVFDGRLTADRRQLVYTANCGDLERRHLWRVSVAGGAPARATTGNGLEWQALPLASGALACLSSTGTRAPAVSLVEPAGPRPLVADATPAGLIEPQMVTWTSGDGRVIHGQLFVPRAIHGRAPALLFLHGGPVRQMMPGWPAMLYYQMTYAMSELLALSGYVVLAPNFRGGVGYGRDFRLAAGTGGEGASEYQDVLSAAQYLRRRTDVDPHKIGLWGGSYGGYLTALGLARNSDLFVAGVDYAGVHDWSRFLTPIAGAPLPEAERKRALAASPVGALAGWRSPVLFVHGDDDINVDFQQTVDLVQRLRALDHPPPIETLVLPDEVHFLLRYDAYLKWLSATFEFLQRHLGAAAAATGTP
jgi:dipeptidyl aminopeptidase/acylaminoacyl peptidase